MADPNAPVRSRAWLLYAFFTVVAAWGLLTGADGAFGLFLLGLASAGYATYLYRGGRYVWIPLPSFIATPLGIAQKVQAYRARR